MGTAVGRRGAALAAVCAVVLAVPATAQAAMDDRVLIGSATGYTGKDIVTMQIVQADGREKRNPDPGAPLFDRLQVSHGPLWSPDAGPVAFLGAEHDDDERAGTSEVRGYTVRLAEQDGSPARVLADGATGARGGLTWTNDGSHLAYVAGPGDDTRLGLVRRDGSARALVDTGRRDMAMLQWSPDGGLVSFTSRTPEGALGLFAVRPDGSDLRLLADQAGIPGSPTGLSWSPDGDRFVYLRNAPESTYTVRIVGRDGSVERDLGQGYGAVWSPDGTTIALTRAWGDNQVSLVDPDTGEERQLAVQMQEDFAVSTVTSWSPDSRHLTAQVHYTIPPTYGDQTWVIDVQSGAAQRVDSDAYVSKYGGYGVFAPLPTTPPPTRGTTSACPPDRVPSAGFQDTSGSPFVREIDCVAWYDVARGTSADTYSPGNGVTRVQMAQFLTRVAERAEVELDTSDAGFSDLDGLSANARDAVNAVAHLGVAQGAGDGRFSPHQLVSRGQMASFLARLHTALAEEPLGPRVHCFSDASTSVHRAAAEALCGAGVAAGVAPGRYVPGAAVTRGQMAAFLARLLDVEVEAGVVQTP